MKKTLQNQQIEKFVGLLRVGDEKGLAYFYNHFYSYYFTKTLRAVHDECSAESIVQEAFLRLWLCRKQLTNVDDIKIFLKKQIKSAIQLFYRMSRNRFNRSLLQLDAIADYQEFLLGYELQEQEDIDLNQIEKLEKEKKDRMDQLQKILPSLKQQQQLYIKICLKYDFNYERIGNYLGGISDYEVNIEMEKAIQTLRTIFNSAKKMETIHKSSPVLKRGVFSDQQAEIFHMRYELNFSFEQISDLLHLNTVVVKTLFVQAHAKLKTARQNAS